MDVETVHQGVTVQAANRKRTAIAKLVERIISDLKKGDGEISENVKVSRRSLEMVRIEMRVELALVQGGTQYLKVAASMLERFVMVLRF